MSTVKRRPYQSRIRRGDAASLICAAAARLFSAKGYVATSIEEIAAEAGVARPTVFTAVGAKSVILKTVFDQTIVGDDTPVPVADRPWWKEAVEEPDPVRSLQLHARNVCWISERSALLVRAVEAAADADHGAAQVWTDYQRQRRIGMADYVATLATKATLRYDEESVTDILWALIPSAYLRLVVDAGWPVEKFQGWLADTMQRQLLDTPATA